MMHGLISRRCFAVTPPTPAGAARGILRLGPNVLRRYSVAVPVDQDGHATVGEPSRLGRVLGEALKATAPRSNWTKHEIREVYNTPLLDLVHHSVCTLSLVLFQDTLIVINVGVVGIWGRVTMHVLIQGAGCARLGHHSQTVPLPVSSPDVYPHEYQDGGLL